MELVVQCAAAVVPGATRVLDVGCGAGNYTLALLGALPGLHATLLDLSRPMLDRAQQRVAAAGAAGVELVQGDVREVDLAAARFDVILAGAVLHHLRTQEEWRTVARKFHGALAPGGTLLVSDLVDSAIPGVRRLMTQRYARYLESLKGPEYRAHVLDYVEREDSPWPMVFQLDTLREAGFAAVDVLHKNACFATYIAVKG